MSHWRRRATEGAEFWISCKRPAFLSNFSHLQLIQNSPFSVARRRQCDIWIYHSWTEGWFDRSTLVSSPLNQFSKFNNILWVCWFLGKNLVKKMAKFSPRSCWMPPKLSRPTGQIRYALNANLFNAQSYLASWISWRKFFGIFIFFRKGKQFCEVLDRKPFTSCM